MNSWYVGIFGLLLALPLWGQSPTTNETEAVQPIQSPSTGALIEQLRADSLSLSQSLSALQATFAAAEQDMRQDANGTRSLPYQHYLREIVRTERNADGQHSFLSPSRLRNSTQQLSQWFTQGYTDSLAGQFRDEVDPAYIQTLITALVFNEHLRKLFWRRNGPLAHRLNTQTNLGTRYHHLFVGHHDQINNLVYSLMSTMEALRAKDIFAGGMAPNFEAIYRNSLVPESLYIEQRDAQGRAYQVRNEFTPDIEAYFAPFQRNMIPVNALGEATPMGQTAQPHQQNLILEEPEYLKEHHALQFVLIRLDYFLEKETLELNEEFSLLLYTILGDLEGLDQDIEAVANSVAKLKGTLDDKLDGEKLRNALVEFRSLLRPQRGKLSGTDAEELKKWKWDTEKGRINKDEEAEEEAKKDRVA